MSDQATTKEALEPRLLPCPLLGHAPSKDEWPTGPYIAVSGAPDMPKFYAIVCPSCCSTAYDEDKERVIKKWNSRVPAPIVAPLVDENSAAFTAYNQAVEDAKSAIRHESQGGGYWAATYINAIARRCSPHVYVNRLAPASTVAPYQSDESAWLLEKMHEGNVHYIAADNMLQWTDDPNKALRLARREDAEALCTIVEDCEKIAGHEWPAPVSTVAPQQSDDDDQPQNHAETCDRWVQCGDHVHYESIVNCSCAPASPAAPGDEANTSQSVLTEIETALLSIGNGVSPQVAVGQVFAIINSERTKLNAAPAALRGEARKCIHCDPSFVPTGPDDWCNCQCHVSSYSEGFDDATRVARTPNNVAATTPPSTLAKAAAREWMNTHHGSFETNQAREEALAAIIERCLAGGSESGQSDAS
jgi:hypothetical protein